MSVVPPELRYANRCSLTTAAATQLWNVQETLVSSCSPETGVCRGRTFLQYQVNEEQGVEGAGLALDQQGLGLFRHIPNPRSTCGDSRNVSVMLGGGGGVTLDPIRVFPLPDVDNSSEDELSLCWTRRLRRADPFLFGAASEKERERTRTRTSHHQLITGTQTNRTPDLLIV